MTAISSQIDYLLKVVSTQYPENCQLKDIFDQFPTKKYNANHLKLKIWTFFLAYCEETESKSAEIAPGGPFQAWTGSQIDFCCELYPLRIQRFYPGKVDQQNQQNQQISKTQGSTLC